MCTVYSFPREGVGQQNVYSLCTVYSFFSARYLANPKAKRAEESKYYLHIYYIYYYIVLYINTLYIIIYIIIKNIIIHNNSFSHSLPPIGGARKNCTVHIVHIFALHFPREGYTKITVICTHCTHFTLHFQERGVHKNNCNLYTLYTLLFRW
jgi:hypothetical protein